MPVGQGACKNPGDPAKKPLWSEAAGLYEAALSAAPGRDEAPEAAMNAAYAYKQIGDFNKAIELYNKFIAAYGSEDNLKQAPEGRRESEGRSRPEEIRAAPPVPERRVRRARLDVLRLLQLPARGRDLRQGRVQ